MCYTNDDDDDDVDGTFQIKLCSCINSTHRNRFSDEWKTANERVLHESESRFAL